MCSSLFILRVLLIQLIELLKPFVFVTFFLEIIIFRRQGINLLLKLFIFRLKLFQGRKIISPIQPPIWLIPCWSGITVILANARKGPATLSEKEDKSIMSAQNMDSPRRIYLFVYEV